MIRDLKDEKKFYSWKGTRRETMMKKENVCKRRMVDMENIRLQVYLGLPYTEPCVLRGAVYPAGL